MLKEKVSIRMIDPMDNAKPHLSTQSRSQTLPSQGIAVKTPIWKLVSGSSRIKLRPLPETTVFGTLPKAAVGATAAKAHFVRKAAPHAFFSATETATMKWGEPLVSSP
jgi:hypothetical protein